jgi:Ca-activated chloride channel family protein
MTFDRNPQLRQDWTDNRDKLSSALKKIRLGLGTSLYDAVDEGLAKIKHGKHDKRAILLLTDGEDTSSSLDFEGALLRVRETEVLLYALGIGPDGFSSTTGGPGRSTPPVIGGILIPTLPFPIPLPGRRMDLMPPQIGRGQMDTVNMQVLNDLADASGGKAWLVSGRTQGRQNEIERALDEIASELRSQYSIGYYPTHAMKDGKWHRIELRAKSSGYKVRYRSDYFGG